ncbi:ribosome silencing factor [Pseudodesulfovibrio tunisiensis]|uniref:ribosome silencing factor n=1 Tax=Pseudodesulfovibrio tunisiensis TaxID=463192 RepID=UPI001FB41FD2|nr:ribosome silencing factor [Pseudodesulfovibrio tunisiensis]
MNKEKKYLVMESGDKAKLVADWLDEKQGEDIVMLDVSGFSSVTDQVLVVSARGMKHAQALADHLLDQAREKTVEYLGMEGYRSAEWLLVDLNDVVVHIFQKELRGFYNIEGMWAEARRTDYTA